MADWSQKVADVVAVVKQGEDPNGQQIAFVPGVEDVTAPTIHSFTPAPGTQIESNTPIAFTVTDNVALRRAAVYVIQKDRKLVIHDGDSFSDEFASFSTRVPTTGGFRFKVQHNTGWISTPVFSVSAVDTSGNEAA